MTRRDLIHKWFVYALGLLPLWLLDDYILPRYPLFGVTPMLLPVAAAAVAVLEGAYAGAGFGMAVGPAVGAGLPGGFGGLVLGMALAGHGHWGPRPVCPEPVLSRLPALFRRYPCSAGPAAGAAGGSSPTRPPSPALLQVAVPEFLYSLAWTPVVYLLFRAIFRGVGRTKLA